jgi:hypothetical protein
MDAADGMEMLCERYPNAVAGVTADLVKPSPLRVSAQRVQAVAYGGIGWIDG